MDDLYCKIYVGDQLSRSELEQRLVSSFQMSRSSGSLCNAVLELDVMENEYYSPSQYSPTWEGFVYSRLYLDVEPLEDVDPASYIKGVASLVDSLRGIGLNTVAACDFEDQLPDNFPN